MAQIKTVLLVGNEEALLANEAAINLASEGFQVLVISEADTQVLSNEDLQAKIASAELILVEGGHGNLVRLLEDLDLITGKTVIALYSGMLDSLSQSSGVIYHPEIPLYYRNHTLDNWMNMIRLGASLKIKPGLAYGPPFIFPENFLWHPDSPSYFTELDDYLKWREPEHFNPKNPTVGLMFSANFMASGKREVVVKLIRALEGDGFNVIAGFGGDQYVVQNFFFADELGLIDIILASSLKFHSSYDDSFPESLKALDVPILNILNLSGLTTKEWRASPQGLPSTAVAFNLASPEISGVVEPTVLFGMAEAVNALGGRYYRPELLSDRLEFLLPRLHAFINLRRKKNNEKKIAIFYYNHNPGKGNIGASYLNVFESLVLILTELKTRGYTIPWDFSLTYENLKNLILKGGRNVGSWAPGELEELINAGFVLKISLSEYDAWFKSLPHEFSQKVIDRFGTPQESTWMIDDGFIIIPAIQAGNIVILPEPSRGMEGDEARAYHDLSLYPHHQYIAAYLWLQKQFGADAMIHLGTHATEEWLPGKSAGLDNADPPEALLTNIPNIYPYIVDNLGEGVQAKRRGRGIIITHLVPPLISAAGYGEYVILKERINDYTQAKAIGSIVETRYALDILELAESLGLLELLGLLAPGQTLENHGISLLLPPGQLDPLSSQPNPPTNPPTSAGDTPGGDTPEVREDFAGVQSSELERAVLEISVYLETLENELIPFGLHTFGESPGEERANYTAQRVVEANPGLEPGDILNSLLISGERELEALLKALEGRYIPPSLGNDPIRSPDSLPTGRNFYGLAPGRMPTQAAWDLGQIAANQIIEKYQAEHEGKYPEKVALVLWAVESLRNEGVTEATILALIGAEPTRYPSGTISGVKIIPGSVLKRPRIDVIINSSGLFRDLFPDKIKFLDDAIRLARVQDDIENFIAANDKRIYSSLVAAGLNPEQALSLSEARIFSEAPGTYGVKVAELTIASSFWESEEEIASVYLQQSGFAYGSLFWGVSALESFKANLKGSQVLWQSKSSNLYGFLDNDDAYAYLGGLNLAIKTLAGESPATYIADGRSPGQIRIEDLKIALGTEIRARYLNPQWIEGMMAEDYAGAREMANFVEYLWGFQVTTPEAIESSTWDLAYEVYVMDKNQQDLPEFINSANPFAYQGITARFLETVRKGYWDASKEVQTHLAREYAKSVIANGVACTISTCDNPELLQMVTDLVSVPGVMDLLEVKKFTEIINQVVGGSLEENILRRVRERQNLQNLPEPPAKSPAEPPMEPPLENAEEPNVRGLKMERVEETESDSSFTAGEWVGPILVLALIIFLFFGFKSRRKGLK
ncbi:MAG: cobaltochelatase subunit CobN [Deltaproteobacteria bacterium]|nr:cobaltochelatase subunit CobN [Deltaproteobacteria bacterium]